MTIDERLERLAERHEALTQTVERMMHQQREWQAIARAAESHARLASQGRRAAAEERDFDGSVLERIGTLARIAHLP